MNRTLSLFQLSWVIIYFLFQKEVFAQVSQSTFKLNGKINANMGSVILIPIGDSSYYPNKLDSQEIIVFNGSFIIENPIAYPYSFRIGYRNKGKWQYISSPFFVNSGEQVLVCDTDSLWETPNILNKSMEEWQDQYAVSLKKSRNKDSILLAYATAYPDSYISLWELVNSFSNGYKPIHDSIFIRLSSLLKNNYTGKQLELKFKAARISSVGSLFSFRPLQNEELKTTIFTNLDLGKMTLIDFWFSHCIPCIGQFAKLKELKKKYTRKGFQIIGISIDGEEYIKDWKSVIKKHRLDWKQYLDKNGIFARELSIYNYPSNFLLDSNGRIIAKNIDTGELAKMLKHRLP